MSIMHLLWLPGLPGFQHDGALIPVLAEFLECEGHDAHLIFSGRNLWFYLSRHVEFYSKTSCYHSKIACVLASVFNSTKFF